MVRLVIDAKSTVEDVREAILVGEIVSWWKQQRRFEGSMDMFQVMRALLNNRELWAEGRRAAIEGQASEAGAE